MRKIRAAHQMVLVFNRNTSLSLSAVAMSTMPGNASGNIQLGKYLADKTKPKAYSKYTLSGTAASKRH